jgi:glycosyltransferase involved in cell wall biosynthesis
MSRRSPPLVSVIVPVHGRFEVAARALRSVAAQTHRPIQLIVVDDGSPSPWMPAAGGEVETRVVRLETNRGPGAARDAGRRVAKGEYLAYLDSDDYWAPEHLASLVAALQESTDAGMAYSSTMEIRGGRPASLRRWNDEPCSEILPTLLFRRPWHTSACLWRRELQEAMGGWMPIWHWEDHEHDARAGCLRAKLIHLPEPTCFAEVDSPERLSSSSSMRRRVEGYVRAMLSIAERIRRSSWYQDAQVRHRMRAILLTAAIRASERGLAGLAARAAVASWKWPSPTPRLVLAAVMAVPLVPFAGRGSARIFRWARRAAPTARTEAARADHRSQAPGSRQRRA